MARGELRQDIGLVSSTDSSQNKQAIQILQQREELRNKIALQYAKSLNKQLADLDEKEQERIDKKTAAIWKKRNDERLKHDKEYFKEYAELSINTFDKIKKGFQELGGNIEQSARKVFRAGINALDSGISGYIGTYSNYMSGIEARIQGSNKDFKSLTNAITRGVGFSPYVKQTAVLENLSKLVEQGIVYNVEQRAFLATVSDKIATTFKSFDSNLAQIIKIQQADSTAARLGLEASLTQFFNRTFSDSSYLNSMFNTVRGSLIGAESQLNREQAVELEYVVQKWLGSLSSVGLSDTTIQQLAQGIGYLGSGDIGALSSNQALQNLLLMASQRAGVDYAATLTGGMDAATANKLLRGVVTYGQEIAKNTNYVVRSKYAEMFGLTISDMTSLLNLSSQDLVNISNNMLSYSGAVAETTNQLAQIGSRMSIKEKIDTAFSNVMSTVGEGIAKNAASYTTWLVTDWIESMTGGTSIPSVLAVGSGLIWDTTIEKIIKGGIVGISAMKNVGTILSALSSTGQLSLKNWGAEDYNVRGTGFSRLITKGTSSDVSYSAFIGDTSDSSLYQGSVAGAAQEAKTLTGVESENETTDLLKDNIAPNISQILDLLRTWDNRGGISSRSILGG